MQTKLKIKEYPSRPPADRQMMRDLNQNILFNLIREHAPISRPHLATLSGLSLATVITLTNELVEYAFVSEKGAAESTGGRKASLFEIRRDGHYAIGLLLRGFTTTAVIVNLLGDVLYSENWEILLCHNPVEGLDLLVTHINALLIHAGIGKEQIIGIGGALSGYIDARMGHCIDSSNLDWHHVDVRTPLEMGLGIPVFIDNDVSCITSYEKLFGRGSTFQNFLVCTVGRGIGLGIVIDGEVYRGSSGGAGEFGHTLSLTGGRLCECGKRGCLEEYASYRGIIAMYRELPGEDRAALSFAAETEKNIVQFEEITIRWLIEEAARGNKNAADAFESSGKMLGVSLANLANIFNPEAIILTGEGTIIGDPFFNVVETMMRPHIFSELGSSMPLVVEPMVGFDCWARGAGALVLRHFFSLPVRS